MAIVWALGLVAGLSLTIWSSARAVSHGASLAIQLGVTPFVVGLTIMALGTDLPEIANSISASATGHGDVNVGDSVGSVVTQLTLVTGILSIWYGIATNRRFVVVSGGFTVAALVLGWILMLDNDLNRVDGALLVMSWPLAAYVVHTHARTSTVNQPELFSASNVRLVTGVIGFLALVGLGAFVALTSFTELAATFGFPEFVTSFFVLPLGTSLPELVVGRDALRRGEASLAAGGLIGSSLLDSTVSLGIGPLLFPIVLSSGVARGTLVAAIAVAIAVAVLASRNQHGRTSGALLVGVYVLTFALVLL